MTRIAVFVFALFLSSAVLNAQVEVPKEVQGDEEYINWWKSPMEEGAGSFMIHPSGSILAKGSIWYDVNGKTGDTIKSFTFEKLGNAVLVNYDMSSDGKYFAYTLSGAFTSTTFIFEYESGKLISKLENGGLYLKFLGNSHNFMMNRLGGGIVHDIYTINGEKVSSIDISIYSFDFSKDGKYLLVNKYVPHIKDTTIVELWDAKTFTKITTLASFGRSYDLSDVQFSLDGKYMSYKIQPILNTYIYKIPDFELVRKYDIGSVAFLENDLIAITGVENKKAYFAIQDLKGSIDEKLFKSDTLGGIPTRYNQAENSIIVLNTGNLISLNLEKILAKVSVSKTPNSSLFVDYSNKTLTIRSINPFQKSKIAKIFDMRGNIVFQFPIPSNQENSFSIPISLLNGAYILSIDEQAYKFLVVD